MKGRMKQTLGEVLKAARVRRGLTQEQLGSQVGAAAAHLAYLENDQRQPSLELLSRLAEALKLEPNKLFLLAHPEARALFRGQARARRGHDQAWRAFIKRKGLLARYNVQPHELKVLAQAAQLGQVIAPYDFLFILNSIRQAMDTKE
jgi:transcriptional regulator with XRE-family HTH domain